MGFDRFSLLLASRLLLIFLALAASGWLIFLPGYHAATVLAVLATLGLMWEVYSFLSRTNRELARFLDAARYADFGQRFQYTKLGAGFEELGETFTHILDRFRNERQQQETDLRHLKALLEHVPVPLLSIHSDEAVTVWNNAARRLFGSVQVQKVGDLSQFGDEFYQQVTTIEPGERHLATFEADGLHQRLALSASELMIASRAERVVSLMNIQTELDGMQQSAWQDLVRVLTHEIMNSITPVTSLATTAVDLVEDASSRISDPAVVDELDDAKAAVETVARRSDGLMNFVSSYRQLTQPPTLDRKRFRIRDLFADVTLIAGQALPDTVRLNVQVDPDDLDLNADRRAVEQVLINLLQNARQAIVGQADGTIALTARLNRRGHVMISVTDNGPGVADEVASRIFVPFYTTRRDGSGIGLALSRQMMVAHGGNISFTNRPGGGAVFTLVF